MSVCKECDKTLDNEELTEGVCDCGYPIASESQDDSYRPLNFDEDRIDPWAFNPEEEFAEVPDDVDEGC